MDLLTALKKYGVTLTRVLSDPAKRQERVQSMVEKAAAGHDEPASHGRRRIVSFYVVGIGLIAGYIALRGIPWRGDV